MLKAVLFDMDGVLVNSEPEYRKIEGMLFKRVGLDPSSEEVKANAGKGQLEVWSGYKEKYGFPEDPHEVVRIESKIISKYYGSDRLAVISPSVELLKSCAKSGLKVAVATSSIEANAKTVIGKLGIEGHVHTIASGDMVQSTKPAPDIFLLAAKRLGVKPEECIVVEDAKNGVAAAKTAGMKAVGYKAPHSDQDLSASDIIVDSLHKITVKTLSAIASA